LLSLSASDFSVETTFLQARSLQHVTCCTPGKVHDHDTFVTMEIRSGVHDPNADTDQKLWTHEVLLRFELNLKCSNCSREFSISNWVSLQSVWFTGHSYPTSTYSIRAVEKRAKCQAASLAKTWIKERIHVHSETSDSRWP